MAKKRTSIYDIFTDIPSIKIVDVGAMILEGHDPLAPLKQRGATVVGFEPVAVEYEKLRATAPPWQLYLPYAVGDGGEHTFYETNYSMTSSLYEPNTELVEKFHALSELMQVVRTYPIKTHRLDDIAETSGMDYLKIDVQGAELDVLQGAVQRLTETVIVEAEVEFLPLYKNQPLFAEVDSFMRERGFVLHALLGTSGRVFRPLKIDNQPGSKINQILWSNAVYVRDFMTAGRLPLQQRLKLVAVLHEVYGSVDLCASLLEGVDAQFGSQFAQHYMSRMFSD